MQINSKNSHPFAVGVRQLDGPVAAAVGVVQRRLVRAQLDQHLARVAVLVGQPLPQRHHVAQVADADRLLLGSGRADALHQSVQVLLNLCQPALAANHIIFNNYAYY
jgi:hypothetical protein